MRVVKSPLHTSIPVVIVLHWISWSTKASTFSAMLKENPIKSEKRSRVEGLVLFVDSDWLFPTVNLKISSTEAASKV